VISVEPDNVLALRSAEGDDRAFKVLVKRHAGGLAQAARSFGLPETDIDDVVQETFVAAWRALDDYDQSRPFRAWLFSVGLNKMRDLYRFRKVRHFLFGALDFDHSGLPPIEDERPGPEREVAARRELALVTRTLDRLPRDQREAIVLTAIVGLSQPEAAQALGVTTKALEGRISRARERLAQLIPER
jgi:RNA polymerase sigma factor CnrH